MAVVDGNWVPETTAEDFVPKATDEGRLSSFGFVKALCYQLNHIWDEKWTAQKLICVEHAVKR